MLKLTLPVAAALLSTSLLTACQMANSQQANSQQQANTQTPSPAPQQKQETENDMKRISVDQAKAAYDKDGVVIVDTRAADHYKQEHIKGAINIPSNEFQNRYKELPTNKQIIAYCS